MSEEETAKVLTNEYKPKKQKLQQKVHKALCKLFKVEHNPDNWQVVKLSDNPDDLIKLDLRNLTFEIVSDRLVGRNNKDRIFCSITKLRRGLEKVISEMARCNFQLLSKEVAF